MKKRIISLLLVLALVAVLVPQLAGTASASQKLSAAPYTPVEYQYSPNATAGTIRYCSQLTMSPYFYNAYWEPYVSYAGHECLTACVSMALSYVGVSATPAELGNYWNMKGYTGGVPFRTIQWDTQGFGGTYVNTTLDKAMTNYLNGNGKYSPAVIHLNSYSANGHWVMVAGKVNANTYLIVDPANDYPWTMTVSGGNVYYQRNGTDRSEALTNVFQYYNANANVTSAPPVRTHADGSACPSTKLVDIPAESDWAHKGIDYCVEKGLMKGVDDTHFAPEQTMTRAMLVTVLYRSAGSPNVGTSIPFTDVPKDWAYDAIVWAYTIGIVAGESSTTFNPNGMITREQMVTILYRYKTIQSGASKAGASAISKFTDAGNVSDWAQAAFCWAVDSGIINGVGSELQPKGSATRAQVAAILMRYLSQYVGVVL